MGSAAVADAGMEVEVDPRYRFPFRVIQTRADIRTLISRHKSREAAESALAKRQRAERYFHATHTP